MSALPDRKKFSSVLLGAAFLMATSAIGPGFITQTTVFTNELGTSFGFIILCSVIIDIIVQLNIWRVVSVSGLRAQDLANQFLKGSGYVLAVLVVVGGLAFNIGNVAGAALGIQVLAGTDLWIGVIISVVISLFIFWYREAGHAVDVFSKILGILMILLTLYVVLVSNPPLLKAVHHSFAPEKIDTASVLILVGGTVGGYISFAGVHRLIDAGISGPDNVRAVSQNSVRGIMIASTMRILLFLAALGVVAGGGVLLESNPAASVFQLAAGEIGYRIFGVVLWSAAITSVVGSAYTSISFLQTLHPFFDRHYRWTVSAFILFSALIFLSVGRPVQILVIVGALNAFILPVALAIVLMVARKPKWMGSYKHPTWLVISGWAVAIALLALSIKTILYDLLRLWE
ncbi:MAG TPA: NRAMP family divalent metal transporter [Chryseosolibacter sp.]